MLLTQNEIARRIEQVIPLLAQKHQLREEVAEVLQRELEAAFSPMEADKQDFETVLHSIQQVWHQLIVHIWAPTYRVYYLAFQSFVEALASVTAGQPKERRHLAAAFAQAVRSYPFHEEPLDDEQIAVIQEVLDKLALPTLTFKDVSECTRLLRGAGFETFLQLGERVREFAMLSDEP
jgi:hypothetical protein